MSSFKPQFLTKNDNNQLFLLIGVYLLDFVISEITFNIIIINLEYITFKKGYTTITKTVLKQHKID